MSTNNPITYNHAENRYEMSFDGQIVYAEVRRDRKVLYIDYVYAPPELRGKGAAGAFMAQLMSVVGAEGVKAVPLCGYAVSWLQRHAEYKDITLRP
ncbi:MAG TPA: GNAT family N-acetyltransferase [Nitrospira sp.]|nr:GNAT family N-acetyltransferase [Nitrospira sp.]